MLEIIKHMYIVSLVPDNPKEYRPRYLVMGVKNKLGAITYCLKHRENLVGDYSIVALKVNLLAEDNQGNIAMVSLS